MSYNSMKSDFLTILNRSDCSDAQADVFMQQGMQRIQRICRIPTMERAQLITPTDVALTQIAVPPDLIEVIDILVPTYNGLFRPLEHMSYRRLMTINPLRQPCAYARSQGLIYVRGQVPIGDQIQFIYYGNFSAFATPDSDNELSASTPDLAVYAALSYAGDYFAHPNTAQWESRFQAIQNEVTQMAVDLEMNGGPQAIEPAYGFEDDH